MSVSEDSEAAENEEAEAEESEENTEEPAEEATVYSDVPMMEVELSEDDEGYILALYEAELYNYKMINCMPSVFEEESWDTYCSGANILTTMDVDNLGDTEIELINTAKTLRESLIQIVPLEEGIWYIWGDDMPMAEGDVELTFTYDSQDNEDFEPYLVPYLLDDQSEVKGNIIVVAGGGYSSRGNSGEGWPIAESFNELGYNAFVLQRRVSPYAAEDCWLDFQRSVRYLRYYGEELELGGLDCICAAGFSGGAATISGEMSYLYGDIQPTIYYESYVADEVDAENADLDVACIMYGPQIGTEHTSEFAGFESDNPNIPAVFIGVGADDETGAVGDSYTLYESLYGKTITEYHTFAEVGHGFGVGTSGTTSTYWMEMADTFISEVVGEAEETSSATEDVEVPEEYVKYQEYDQSFGFGDAHIVCCVNEDETKFYIYFTAFEDIQILEGLVDDGTVTVTYDKTGFMSGDAQTIYSLADPEAWVDIE